MEILAILKACKLCTTKLSLVNRNIQIVSDSLEAVSWANNLEDFGSLLHVNAVYDIRNHLQKMKGMSIVFNPRASNVMADGLAKMSSNGGADSIVWEEF
ncbi:hypothetical protein Q3G72_014531 [Acer saccharum]|nr:hypothetical protein Q3G72_014531 [Acer saccharum]